jgi:hypothetical protein
VTPKRFRDPNEIANSTIDIAIGESRTAILRQKNRGPACR